jgi:hypothetical protein
MRIGYIAAWAGYLTGRIARRLLDHTAVVQYSARVQRSFQAPHQRQLFVTT